MFDARQHHATQHKNVMSDSCPGDMHDLLLCWSVGDTKHIEIT